MENNIAKATAIMTALLALSLIGSPSAAADPIDDVNRAVSSDDCPFIQVRTYAPYYSLHWECLTIPPAGEA